MRLKIYRARRQAKFLSRYITVSPYVLAMVNGLEVGRYRHGKRIK